MAESQKVLLKPILHPEHGSQSLKKEAWTKAWEAKLVHSPFSCSTPTPILHSPSPHPNLAPTPNISPDSDEHYEEL